MEAEINSDYFAVLNLIKSHPVWAFITIGTGTVLASEVIWSAFKYLRDNLKKRQVHEVLIFNELGQICASKHQQRSTPTSPEVPLRIKCRNKYCTSRNIDRIVLQIDKAKYSIDIAIYTFTSLTLMEAFKRALQRGIAVRIISDCEMVYSSGSQISRLVAFGVAVCGPDSTFMMHHKFCVVDGKARVEEIMRLKGRKQKPQPYCSVLISGSVNWTRQGLGGNWENCVITSDQLFTSNFQAEFNRMWNSFTSSMERFKRKFEAFSK